MVYVLVILKKPFCRSNEALFGSYVRYQQVLIFTTYGRPGWRHNNKRMDLIGCDWLTDLPAVRREMDEN